MTEAQKPTTVIEFIWSGSDHCKSHVMDSSILPNYCTPRDYRSGPKAASRREVEGELNKCVECFALLLTRVLQGWKVAIMEPSTPALDTHHLIAEVVHVPIGLFVLHIPHYSP